jgi:hypothetical protein
VTERLAFSRTLYSVEAVQAAVKTFEHLAKLELEIGSSELSLTMSDPDPDVADVLLDELANHALVGTVIRTQGNEATDGNP